MAASEELTIKYSKLLKKVEDHQPLYKKPDLILETL